MRDAALFGLVIVILLGSAFALFSAAAWLIVIVPALNNVWIGLLLTVIALFAWCLIVALTCKLFERLRSPRAKPEGYIGRFRRPDRQVVHVSRLKDGSLMVASDGQPPRDLGEVTGRDLLTWVKLATSPDGSEHATRID